MFVHRIHIFFQNLECIFRGCVCVCVCVCVSVIKLIFLGQNPFYSLLCDAASGFLKAIFLFFPLAEIFGSNLQCFGCVFNSQNQPYCTLWELAKPDGSTCCLESKSQLCRVFSKLLDSQYPKNLFNLSPTLGRGLHPLVLHLSYHSIFFWHLPFSISSFLLWRKKWQPTPVFLPGKSHGWSLVGYSPWGRKESDMTEWIHFTSLYLFILNILW